MTARAEEPQQLRREVGVFGAATMGLGSIIGTGVFVSIGVAAGITGPSVALAVAIGAAVATFNGLSSWQLTTLSRAGRTNTATVTSIPGSASWRAGCSCWPKAPLPLPPRSASPAMR